MTISEYARANVLDPDTALTHAMLFSMVEATGLDEQWQRRTFQTLVQAVDANKLAASVRALAGEVMTPLSLPIPENSADDVAERVLDSADDEAEESEEMTREEMLAGLRNLDAYVQNLEGYVQHHDILSAGVSTRVVAVLGWWGQFEEDMEGGLVCCACGKVSGMFVESCTECGGQMRFGWAWQTLG